MAQISNTFAAGSGGSQAVGIREDLANWISNISPTATPFLSSLKEETVTNLKHEWQIQTLAPAANNKQIEGDDVAAFDSITPTSRPYNYTQISRKTFLISGSLEQTLRAGRKSEIAYQLELKAKELKRDKEFGLTNNTTAVAPTNVAAGQSRGLPGWIATNADVGAGLGAAPNPGTNTAPVAGTARTISDSILLSAAQGAWNQGGEVDTIYVGGTQKRVFSTTLKGIVDTRYHDVKDASVTGYFDVYKSDFGDFKVVANRFQEASTAFGLQSDLWSIGYLGNRKYVVEDLAKTGDSQKKLLLSEYTLISKNEAGNFQIRDLQ